MHEENSGFSGFPALLTEPEKAHLQTLNSKLQIVRDRVRAVAKGWATGLYLWGEGGISKSFTVEDELKSIGIPYRVVNTRITPKGLFNLLEADPNLVFVLEDAETLCSNDNAAGLLRSALWVTNPSQDAQYHERLVTWHTARESREVVFTGGLILIMNKPLDEVPTLRAVKSRIPHLHLVAKNQEIFALMKSIALQGFRHGETSLSPIACLEVTEYLAKSFDQAGRSYDLRMLVNGFRDRLAYDAGDSVTHWQDLIDSRIRERVMQPAVGRAETNRSQYWVAHEIHAKDLTIAEKLGEWKTKTGKGRDAYYRALKGENREVHTPAEPVPYERDPWDFYSTPTWAVEALLERERFEGQILEPCSGDGKIVEVLEQRGYEVVASDIRTDPEVVGEKGVDAFTIDRAINIVTNPPYRHSHDMVQHFLMASSGKVALLLRFGFMESQKRRDFFGQHKPCRIWVFAKRVKFLKQGRDPINAMSEHAWFVWEKGWEGETVIERID